MRLVMSGLPTELRLEIETHWPICGAIPERDHAALFLVVLPVIRILARALRDRAAQLLARVTRPGERLREAGIDDIDIAALAAARGQADAAYAAREQRDAFVESHDVDRHRKLGMFARFHHGDRAVRGRNTAIRVRRRPRADLLLFTDAVAPRRRVAHGAFDELARMRAPDVPQNEPDRPADRRVRAPAIGPEDPLARMEPELAHNRSGDQREYRCRAGGLRGIDRKRGIDDALDRGQHHRHVFRQAARHRAVGGDIFDRGYAVAGKYRSQHFVCVASDMIDDIRDGPARRRKNRQTVGPSLGVSKLRKLLDRFESVHLGFLHRAHP